MDGTSGSSTFTDSSPSGKTVSAIGATISNVQNKFGGSSGYFGTTGGKYLTIPYSAELTFGSGDFTVDFWYYPLVHGGSYNIQCMTGSSEGVNNGWAIEMQDGIKIQFEYSLAGTSWTEVAASYTFTNNSWYHIAVVRRGNLAYLFVNGTMVNPGGTSMTGSIHDTGSALCVGQYVGHTTSNPIYAANSYIDEFRISKGIARWTSNFTPPTAPY